MHVMSMNQWTNDLNRINKHKIYGNCNGIDNIG